MAGHGRCGPECAASPWPLADHSEGHRLREGQLLENHGGRFVRVYRSPEADVFLPLACDDNLSGRPLWQVSAPDGWAHDFIEGTHLVYWYAWEPKDRPPVQAKAMSLFILDEKGQERDRFLCPVSKQAVKLVVKARRIEVWLRDKRLLSRNAAWLEQAP